MVHGIEERYGDRVDFIYLDISEPDVRPAMEAFGFRATPHFFVRATDGSVTWSRQGMVDEEVFIQELEAVLR